MNRSRISRSARRRVHDLDAFYGSDEVLRRLRAGEHIDGPEEVSRMLRSIGDDPSVEEAAEIVGRCRSLHGQGPDVRPVLEELDKDNLGEGDSLLPFSKKPDPEALAEAKACGRRFTDAEREFVEGGWR